MPPLLQNLDRAGNGLVAILLITRSRPGPKLVFRYPVQPKFWIGESITANEQLEHDIESDSESGESANEVSQPRSRAKHVETLSELTHDNSLGPLIEHDDCCLGLDVNALEKILAPEIWADRKKFEICLNGLTFVGHPIHANRDGQWSRPTRSQPQSPLETSIETLKRPMSNDGIIAPQHGTKALAITITGSPSDDNSTDVHDFTHIPESLDSQREVDLSSSLNSASSVSEDDRDRITMFHVVCAMRSDHAFIQSVYRDLCKKLSKALLYCQGKNNYVATEVRKIAATRAKAKTDLRDQAQVEHDILSASELAKALQTIFHHASRDTYAKIRLNGMTTSLQIATEERPFESVEGTAPRPHQALLLTTDKETLLTELAGCNADPLAYFIREQTPTKTLQKQAIKLGVPLGDVLFLAQHLLSWRKAKLIAPLRPANFYVVNPKLDLGAVASRTTYYNQQFMTLPSLQLMLKILSGRPIRYVVLIPSRDHRSLYMQMLACLVLDGFVVPLNTYGWLRGRPDSSSHSRIVDRTIAQPYVNATNLLSPHLRPVEDDLISVSSGRTAIQRAVVPPPSQERDENTQEEDMIVLDPETTTFEEVHLIKQIRSSIGDEEVRSIFPSLLPYFNGAYALEEIASRESLKRAIVDRAIDVLESSGHLLLYRSTS